MRCLYAILICAGQILVSEALCGEVVVVCVWVCVFGGGGIFYLFFFKRALAGPTPAADKGSRLRKYQPDFLKYGFSCTTKNSVDYPQWVGVADSNAC